ncbi:hypothetical protein GM3709_2337 [Geminocystis sp. NIES-3709]|nr:hypothetical protein GM3709_2337 [Geminocystis sp. NIES-3709]
MAVASSKLRILSSGDGWLFSTQFAKSGNASLCFFKAFLELANLRLVNPFGLYFGNRENLIIIATPIVIPK